MRKLTALVLSWAIPATSVWAAAPPSVVEARPSASAAPASQSGPDLPSFGVLVGQVLSDATGLPVAGASVQLSGSPEGAQAVDGEGRFALPAPAGAHVLVAEKEGFVAVERSASAAAGQGTAVVDARLTPLGAPTTIGASGGTAAGGGVTVTVGSGVVSGETGFIVTPLSGQGLPNRLPLGFAPVLAFDLRAGRTVSGPFAVRLSGLPAVAALHLVEYRPLEHAWFLTDGSLLVDQGIANSSLPGVGAYAVVRLDEDGPGLPAPGAALSGAPPAALPAGLTGTATVEPLRVPASGATARGHLTAGSPSDLPSGTLMQARLTESFTLGSVRIEDEPRLQDVVAYRAQPGSARTLKATIPLTALRTFGSAEPVTGRLKLEFWTGRPSLAGSVGGGSESVTVESGPARLVVPAGSLATDTAVSIQSVPLSAFLPSAPGVTALGEVVIDLSGGVLSQGAELSLASSASGTLVIARVERLSGVPYLTVVSLAQSQGGRVVSTSYPGLPGIVRGGRYVFYRVDGALGFVAGTTTSPTGPVRAVVGTTGLPFVGVSSASGAFITAASPGAAAQVTARVPHTPHQAVATVAVTAGQTTTQDLTLTAGLTTAEVVPADGATAVPVSVSLQLTASQPLDEATVTATSIRLIKGNPDSGPTVTTRRQLSADGKTLSIVPESALEPATVYVLRVAGLKDAYAGPVNVADVHFTTRADVTPEYDLGKLKFSFPNAEGVVTVTAAAGSFPPGTTVMVINDSTAAVLTMTVDNEGGIAGVGNELLASLDDVMVVSLSDSLGNTFTERRSKYVDAASGRTSIGSTGGVVEGSGGVELRLPPGAVSRGVVFKADAVAPASVPPAERPVVPGGTLGAVIKIEAPSQPVFRKEVDLAFPKPADAPAGAFFYVYRKLQGPNGIVLHQTIDSAAVEGNKVVTNSPPFSGYTDSYGGFALGPTGSVAIASATFNISYLMWTFDELLPGRSNLAVFNGRVTRRQWNAGGRRWENVPVEGALVRRVVNGQDPFMDPAVGYRDWARTGPDGVYTFFSPSFSEAQATVRATAGGESRDATAYAVPQPWGPSWVRVYGAWALTNFEFTSAPPPAELQIARLEQRDGAWQRSETGIVATGTPLALGFGALNAMVQAASVNGSALSLEPVDEADHAGMSHLGQFTPFVPGTLIVTLSAQPASGPPVSRSVTLLAVAGGGSNNETLPGPPRVLEIQSWPQTGATGVSPLSLPRLAFSEPVRNVIKADNLRFFETAAPADELAFRLRGSGPGGPVELVEADHVVSSLTLEPEVGLKSGTEYTIEWRDTIRDLDTGDPGDPKKLDAGRIEFRTFDPSAVGGTDAFGTAGLVVLGDRAYVAEKLSHWGRLRAFDVSDPSRPAEIPPVDEGHPVPDRIPLVEGRVVDVAGQDEETTVTQGRLVLVGAANPTPLSRPSNIHAFDVSRDQMRPVAVVSVTNKTSDGILHRVAAHRSRAYALTQRKGLHVVDLERARLNYETQARTEGGYWDMVSKSNLDGVGFSRDAVVSTIQIGVWDPPRPHPDAVWQRSLLLYDFKVGDYQIGGEPQTLAVVTGVDTTPGSIGNGVLAVVRADRGDHYTHFPLPGMHYPSAIALGRLGARDVAVVVGIHGRVVGPGPPPQVEWDHRLAVVDLSNPASPSLLSMFDLSGARLPGQPTDVVLDGNVALVAGAGETVLVSLVDPARPAVVGRLQGVGGRLALGLDGIVFGSHRASVLGGDDAPFSGVRAGRYEECGLLDLLTPELLMDLVVDPINNQACGVPERVVFKLCRPAHVTLTLNNAPLTAPVDGRLPELVTNVPLEAGFHEVTIQAGMLGLAEGPPQPFQVSAAAIGGSGDPARADGTIRNRIKNRSVLPVGHTFVKGVNLFKGSLVKQGMDLKLKGRHLSLESSRTYSSAGNSGDGLLGAGWSWNYESQIVRDECGRHTVVTADGSSQVFSPDFRPQQGYHTKLRREGQVLIFTDKAGNEHHFREETRPGHWRLDFIEEPHGDRIAVKYDARGRVEWLGEVHPDRPDPVRKLQVVYTRRGQYDRILSISAVGEDGRSLGLSASYSYDDWGNLITARRQDRWTPSDPAARPEEHYGYSWNDPRDRHQMQRAEDPNGGIVYYQYTQGPIPGAGVDQREFVRAVQEHPVKRQEGDPHETTFAYDATEFGAPSFRWKTVVTDPRDNPTAYVLTSGGSPLEIQEPMEKTTKMGWHQNDVLKEWEEDGERRRTSYEYDLRGNLKTETVHTLDPVLGDVVTRYVYNQTFNKLERKEDAEGFDTVHVIDGQGDLAQTTDAEGNVTVFGYTGPGLLETVQDPRGGLTRHSEWDRWGNAWHTAHSAGRTTHRSYDRRGRLEKEWDNHGHEIRYEYGAFDRVSKVVRVAGGDAEDEETRTEYDAGGLVEKVINPEGLITTYERDGLGRITKTTFTVPSPFEGRLRQEFIEEVLEYDGNGNKVLEKDRRDIVRRNEHDELNRLRKVFLVGGVNGQGPPQPIAEYEYDLVGNRTAEINTLTQARTDLHYDKLYRLSRKQLPESAEGPRYEEHYQHDKVGNRTYFKDANGHETRFGHDGLGRVKWTRNALLQEITTKYDWPANSHADKSEEHDSTRGLRTRFEYDSQGRETKRTVFLEKPVGSEKTYTTVTAYDDPAGKATVTVSASGDPARVRVAYRDGLDRVIQEGPVVEGQELLTKTAYDGLGNKTRVEDREGHETHFFHDALGRLVKTRDGQGFESEAAYHGDGLKLWEKDRRTEGVRRSFQYDNLGRLTREQLVSAPITGRDWNRSIVYDDAGRTRTEKDVLDRQTVFHLDKMERVVEVRDHLDKSARMGYDGVNKRWEKDRRGNQRDFEYDALNRPTKVTDPPVDGARHEEVTEYLDGALQKRVTDRRQKSTVTQLDPLGRVVSVARQGVLVERHGYDASGNRVLSVDGAGNQTKFVYDEANRLKTRIDGFEAADPAETSTTEFGYYRDGLLRTEKDARALLANRDFSLLNEYDAAHRLRKSTDGAGQLTQYNYDGEGNRTWVKEPEGPETTYDYEELGKLWRITQPAAPPLPPAVTRYVYDSARNLTEQHDAFGLESRVVRLEYTPLNQLRKRVQPGGLVTELHYDDDGNVDWVRDPKGQKVISTYDTKSRLVQKDFEFAPGDPDRPWRHTTRIKYTYDPNNNLEQVQEFVASGSDPPPADPPPSIVRTWDDFDRLETETTRLPDGGASRTVSHSYYANGLRQTVTIDGVTTTYTYDAQKRLKSATSAGGSTTYTYWPDSLLKEVTYPNGVKATHGYDLADRLETLVNSKAGTTISSYAYSYDLNGNRLSQTEINGGLTELTTYSYDPLNRLETVTYPVDTAYPAGRVVTYGYDPVGNRTSEITRDSAQVVLASKQGVFDSLNRLTELRDLLTPANTITFGWDDNGNQTSKTASGVTTEYRYDLRDKLVEVVQGSSTPGRFQYDAEGRRIKKIGEDGVRQYVYDQTSLLAEYDSAGNAVAKYEYGSDRLISLTRGTEQRFYLFDALRSVTNITTEAGLTAASYHLDAWGNFRFPGELGSSDSTASKNRFAFTGYLWDQETALYYAKARFYDPEVGRFTSQDSYLGEINDPPSLHRYFYANARPTYFVDPTGHCTAAFSATNMQDCATAALVGIVGPPANFFMNWGSTLLYNATGNDKFLARAEAFQEQKKAIDWALRSPAHLATAIGEGSVGTLNAFSQGINEGRGEDAAGVLSGALAQAATAGAGGGFRMTPTGGLATAEGVVFQGGATVARTGPGLAGTGILLAGNTKDEVSGTQGENGNNGPGGGDRDPLPADKSPAQQPGRVRIATPSYPGAEPPLPKEIDIANVLAREKGMDVLLRGSSVPGGDALLTLREGESVRRLRAEFKTMESGSVGSFQRNLRDASRQTGQYPGAVVLDARGVEVSAEQAGAFTDRAIGSVAPRRPNLREVYVLTEEGVVQRTVGR